MLRYSTFKMGFLLAVISLLVKLPYLGTFLTIDEERWIRGAGNFARALYLGDLAGTYWHFHPGITITWVEALILWVQSGWHNTGPFDEFVMFQTRHPELSVGAMRLSGVILTSLALVVVFWLAELLVGKWPAILGTGLLAVDPFWVAHSRIVNGDALTAVLMLVAFLAFLVLLIQPQQKFAVISGVFVGLSFLTKLPAQILVPVIILLAVVGYFKNKNWRFWLTALMLCGLSSMLVFVALWPAMWVAPIETLKTMYLDTFVVGDIGGKDKVEFFWGQIVDQQSTFFYPLALAFRLTPINVAGMAAALALLIAAPRHQSKTIVLLLFVYVILVVLFANISPKKADRYAMAVIPAIDLLTGVALIWLCQKLKWPGKRPLPLAITSTSLIAAQFAFVWLNYPYVLTYYNPLLGGYAQAAQLVPVGRGEGLEQAAHWINNQPDGPNALISPYYENVTDPYLLGKSLGWSKTGESQVLADYVVFYITQTQRKLPYPQMVDYFLSQTPVHTIYFGPTPYIWIYKAPVPVTRLAGDASIVGRAELVGYSQLQQTVTPGSTIDFVLYFLTEDQPLPQNENFAVWLVDGQGNRHGEWRGDAANNWQPQSIVPWKGQLFLPKTILPDNYRLRVSLMDTNLNSEVTFFPFKDVTIIVSEK